MGVKVTTRENENVERALRRLKKAMAEEGIRLKRTRPFYMTRGQKRREARNRMRRRALRALRDAQRR